MIVKRLGIEYNVQISKKCEQFANQYSWRAMAHPDIYMHLVWSELMEEKKEFICIEKLQRTF